MSHATIKSLTAKLARRDKRIAKLKKKLRKAQRSLDFEFPRDTRSTGKRLSIADLAPSESVPGMSMSVEFAADRKVPDGVIHDKVLTCACGAGRGWLIRADFGTMLATIECAACGHVTQTRMVEQEETSG